MRALLGLFLAVAVVAGCAVKAHDDDFAGLVGLGNGRGLFLECRGSGSPTAFIIPGKGSWAAQWNVVVPAVARTTRICAYDRPNTRRAGSDRSTSVAQPHTVAQDVDDIVKLVAAARLSTPMVVVAHSYGALIADLLARTHPEFVSGLVFVDPTSEFLLWLGRPDQDAEFDRQAQAPAPEPYGEGFLAGDAFARLKAAPAPPLPRVPAVVLSSDRFPPPADLPSRDYTTFQVHRANSVLADTLWADNLIVADSGRDVMLNQPQVVAAKIVRIVGKVRSGSGPGR